jgi:hypothetical protein
MLYYHRLKAGFVLLDLDHQLVDVDQLCGGRTLRQWRQAHNTGEPEIKVRNLGSRFTLGTE